MDPGRVEIGLVALVVKASKMEKSNTMAKINSRSKGKRGELMFRDVLRRYGIAARRGQQFAGSADGDSPDVVHDLDGVHFEVKWVERLNVHEAMAQARRDCGDKAPVVAHKRNGTGWLVTMAVEDFMRLIGRQDFSDL